MGVICMIKKGKHYCDKDGCGIELKTCLFPKFKFEYRVSPNGDGLLFRLELCTKCEEELARIVSSLMNKYLTAPEIKYPNMIQDAQDWG